MSNEFRSNEKRFQTHNMLILYKLWKIIKITDYLAHSLNKNIGQH